MADERYGWVIAGVSVLALIVSNGLAIGGMPVFSKDLRGEFLALAAIDTANAETFLSNAANLTFIMSGVFSLIGGWLMSRWRIKPLMILGCVLLGAGLLVHASAQTAAGVYFARFLMGASLGFVGVAPNVVLISRWFVRSRGTAVGLVLTGTSIGGVLMPMIAAPFITQYGWRSAMVYLSLIVWLVLLPAIIFLVREPGVEKIEADGADRNGMSLAEAVKIRLFWVFGLAAASIFYPIFATTQQFILYLQSPRIGLSLSTAALAQSALFAVSVGGKFLAGYLSDKLPGGRIMLFFAGVMFLSTLVLFHLTADTALLFLLPFGLGYGGIFVLIQRLAGDYFGPKDYGKILGAITLIEIAGASIGGRVTGYLADKNAGDYSTAFYGVAVSAAVALLCAVVLSSGKFQTAGSRTTSTEQ